MLKKILFIFLVVMCLLKTDKCYAQWQPDVRLTNDPGNSNTSYNNAWCVASSGDVVHIVWYDNRNGNLEIYYKRSTDGGIGWGADTRLTNNSFGSGYPTVTVSGPVVHIVWLDERDGNTEIYYKRSTDGGVSWGADVRLTNALADSWYPSVSVSGPVVHVSWMDFRDGNNEIYYKRSTDAGVNWSVDTRLTNNTAESWDPAVSVSGQVVHIVWEDDRDGNYEIYYKGSTDGGISWGADTRLTNNAAGSGYPCVSVTGQVVHVVWHDDRHFSFQYEIYYKRSTDGGLSWGSDVRLTNNAANSAYPSVHVSGSGVHVVWHDERDGNSEIYYKLSADGGVSWGTDTRLTNSPFSGGYPSVSVSGQVVHVVWQDQRDGNWEIYYKRNPTGNVVGIININSEIPIEFSLSQNYPNPFNPRTKIRFALPNSSYAKLIVYDAQGKEVETILNKQLEGGAYEIVLDGMNYPSGVYYYKLTAGDFVETKKMVLVK